MNPTTPKSFRKSIQVLVFQDGLASRSFEIPLSWISRLGWYLGGCALVTILAITGTIQLWKSSHRSQPERLRELEQQIQTLGDANKALEAKAVAAASSAAEGLGSCAHSEAGGGWHAQSGPSPGWGGVELGVQ